MARVKRDLVDSNFGLWRVISPCENYKSNTYKGPNYAANMKQWLCKCSCGTMRPVLEKHLVGERSKSCQDCCYGNHKLRLGDRISTYVVVSNLLELQKYSVLCDCGKKLQRRIDKLSLPHSRCSLNSKFKREIARTRRKSTVVMDMSSLGLYD